MGEFYLQIKSTHIGAVILSGSLFTLRGLLMLGRSRWSNHAALRYLSYTIDTVLLTAALLLTAIVHQYPFVQGWLTAKVLLLAAYVVLGAIALTRGRTRRAQVAAFVAALAVYGFIVSVALAHHPLGVVHTLLNR